MAQATIILELFKSGIHLTCEDTGADEFIPHGDGNKLMEVINKIEIDTDPDTTYKLTDKGKRLLELIDSGINYDEAMEICDKEFDNKKEDDNKD